MDKAEGLGDADIKAAILENIRLWSKEHPGNLDKMPFDVFSPDAEYFSAQWEKGGAIYDAFASVYGVEPLTQVITSKGLHALLDFGLATNFDALFGYLLVRHDNDVTAALVGRLAIPTTEDVVGDVFFKDVKFDPVACTIGVFSMLKVFAEKYDIPFTYLLEEFKTWSVEALADPLLLGSEKREPFAKLQCLILQMDVLQLDQMQQIVATYFAGINRGTVLPYEKDALYAQAFALLVEKFFPHAPDVVGQLCKRVKVQLIHEFREGKKTGFVMPFIPKLQAIFKAEQALGISILDSKLREQILTLLYNEFFFANENKGPSVQEQVWQSLPERERNIVQARICKALSLDTILTADKDDNITVHRYKKDDQITAAIAMLKQIPYTPWILDTYHEGILLFYLLLHDIFSKDQTNLEYFYEAYKLLFKFHLLYPVSDDDPWRNIKEVLYHAQGNIVSDIRKKINEDTIAGQFIFYTAAGLETSMLKHLMLLFEQTV